MEALGVFGFLGLLICFIMIIISAIKKNNKIKKWGIGIVICFIVFVVGITNITNTETKQANQVIKYEELKTEEKAEIVAENLEENKKEPIQVAGQITQFKPVTQISVGETQQLKPSEQTVSEIKEEKETPILNVHFINVGQADCIFIDYGDYDILIDAGNNNDGASVVDYLKKLNTDDIEILVATHPHEDHIGGLDDVLAAFKVENIIDSGKTATTNAYKDYWSAVQNEKSNYQADKDLTFNISDQITFKVIETGDSFSNINNYSVITVLNYNNIEFLFTGDMESEAELAVLNKFFDIEVLKVGHHGSRSSTSQQFLNKVSPEYAVISCGKNNSYGHPHVETLQKLKDANVKTFRTDEQGTIIATTDGEKVVFNINATTIQINAQPVTPPVEVKNDTTIPTTENADKKEITVYITNSGAKYHTNGCQSLSKSKIPITLNEAKAQGYTPCSKCHPPQ